MYETEKQIQGNWVRISSDNTREGGLLSLRELAKEGGRYRLVDPNGKVIKRANNANPCKR